MATSSFTPPPASAPSLGAIAPSMPPPSLITRGQRFLEENWVPVLIGCGVLAAGGAYLYTRQNDPSGPSTGLDEKKDRKGKTKKKKHPSQGRQFGEGSDGPLVEELPRDVKESSHDDRVSSLSLIGWYSYLLRLRKNLALQGTRKKRNQRRDSLI